jgi:hypothetical protein
MCDAFVWSFDALTGLNWLEIIKALAPVVTAFIAWRALQNWRRQDKAKRQADFLDQLTEAVHGYVNFMPDLISMVEFAKIGMHAHRPMINPKHPDIDVAGAIEFIEKRGADHYRHMARALDAARPALARMQSLLSKGQVLGFKEYDDCGNACVTLRGQFIMAQGLASFIRSPTWNWENPEIIAHLKPIIAIDPTEMQKLIDDNTKAFHMFLRVAYAQIYGK